MSKGIPLIPNWKTAATMMCMVMRNGSEQGKLDAEKELIEMGAKLDELAAIIESREEQRGRI